MIYKRRSMVRIAMVFMMITFFTLAAAGCGEDAAYEAVRTVQDDASDAAVSQGGTIGDTDGSAGNGKSGSAGETDADAGNGKSGSAGDTDGDTESGKGGKDLIYVYVCGAVVSPGVIRLPADARVCDAIEAAGGLTEDADGIHTNLAGALTDGQQITVPTVSEAAEMDFPQPAAGGTAGAAGTGPQAGNTAESSLVNINTADAATLQTLSGIGAARAADIIAYREENGGFSCIEDITKVSGIGDRMFQKIKDRITV